MRRTIFFLVAALLLAAACGTAGSESDGEDVPGPQVLASSAQNTIDEGSAHVAIEQETSISGHEIASEADGVVDFESGAMEATMKLEAPGLPPQEFDMLMVDLVGYFESSFIPGLRGGAEWVKFDFAKASEAAGIDLEALIQTGEDQLAYLEQVSDVERVGRETVREVDTTKYSFTTDFEELARTGPEDMRASLRVLIDDFGLRESPGEVWLDDDGLVRRVRFDTKGDEATIDTTIEYFDFGVEVDVDAPPESETIDIMDLAPPTKTKTKA
jgi:hypothetical protein